MKIFKLSVAILSFAAFTTSAQSTNPTKAKIIAEQKAAQKATQKEAQEPSVRKQYEVLNAYPSIPETTLKAMSNVAEQIRTKLNLTDEFSSNFFNMLGPIQERIAYVSANSTMSPEEREASMKQIAKVKLQVTKRLLTNEALEKLGGDAALEALLSQF